MVREVVITMLEFGTEEMERGNLTVALEHFSELLDFLHFKFLPGVLLKRAECLLQLVKTISGLFIPFSNHVNARYNVTKILLDIAKLTVTSRIVIYNVLWFAKFKQQKNFL